MSPCYPYHGNWFLMPSEIHRIHSSHFMLSDCQGGLIIFDSSEFETWARIQSNSSHWKAYNANAKCIYETLKTSWFCNYPVNISPDKQPRHNDKIWALFCIIAYTNNMFFIKQHERLRWTAKCISIPVSDHWSMVILENISLDTFQASKPKYSRGDKSWKLFWIMENCLSMMKIRAEL